MVMQSDRGGKGNGKQQQGQSASLDSTQPLPGSLAARLADRQCRAVVTFGGQGNLCLDEIAALLIDTPQFRPLVARVAATIGDVVQHKAFRWSGHYSQGFDLMHWLDRPAERPSSAYLTSSAISQPLIFLCQVLRFQASWREGLAAAFDSGAIAGLSGHSQGMMAALLIAESADGRVEPDRLVQFIAYMTWQGLHMACSADGSSAPAAGGHDEASSPMAAISGLDAARLDAALVACNANLAPELQLTHALFNTRTRHVVSGPPASLARLRKHLEAGTRTRGPAIGPVTSFTWEFLAVGAPFHSPAMVRGLEAMRQTVAEIGFEVRGDALHLPVLSPEDGGRLDGREDLTEALMAAQFIAPVRWAQTVRRLINGSDIELVLDMGPGEGVARLTGSALKGQGVEVLALSTAAERKRLFSVAVPVSRPVLRYADHGATLGRIAEQTVIDNRFSRWTGCAPIILPGMTPTTADVPIVAAAANAGFVAELAGGGQPTERIFWLRMEELAEALDPGREVVFNALLLDPWLWELHLGRHDLVRKARRAGMPLCGVTISAGIPEVDRAVKLLDELAAEGLWLNSFKPGNAAQVAQVARIARAAPHHVIGVHLEGGKAGGHHSWLDLDDLLLDAVPQLRACDNLVLCAGGGIGDEARANELLSGGWSAAHDLPAMPVDAIFLGTLAMACSEAATSAQVKSALVQAPGDPGWLVPGQVRGAITSGRSQLNADIHYLDNAASRCGRLLDAVAGDADAVAEQFDRIVAALAATSKPWFGDLSTMTPADLLRRMLELMAIGRHGRYEDGPWPDTSWRQRFADMLRRLEARLSAEDEGLVQSVLADLAELDQPQAVLERFLAAHPDAPRQTLHPADADFFVRQVCARPGKPINFVPVIDADVRRWFKSDSLWQSHDERLDANAVLVVPGPAAVAGIRRADEPVAELLGRFDASFIDSLREADVPAAPIRRRRRPERSLPISGLAAHVDGRILRIVARPSASPTAWFQRVPEQLDGPVAAFFGAERVLQGRTSRPNPIRSLCPVRPGAALRIELARDGQVAAIHYAEADGSPERVHLRLVDGKKASLQLQIDLPTVADRPTPPPFRLEVVQTRAVDGGFALAGQDAEALRAFYLGALFDGPLPQPEGTEPSAEDALFAPRRTTVQVESERVAAYAALTGAAPTGAAGTGAAPTAEMPAAMTFSLLWRPLFATLCHDDLAGGLLDLVHLDNRIDRGPAAPPKPGESLTAEARIVAIADEAAGRTITVLGQLSREGQVCARLLSRFFVRGDFGRTTHALRRREHWRAAIAIEDPSALAFLLDHDWLQLDEGVRLAVGERVELQAEWFETRPRAGRPVFSASGSIHRAGEVVGRIALSETVGASAASLHPLAALVEVLGEEVDSVVDTPRRTLVQTTERAPVDGADFGDVGGDLNPIHRSAAMARLAGLPGPIVHGMWTAARVGALLRDQVAGGDGDRLDAFEAAFLAPVLPGELLHMDCVRIGMTRGRQVVEATARVERDGDRIAVLRATALVAPPLTAFVFPGQGIQQPKMGMEAYQRSAEARRVWDRADRYTRDNLGFSILAIVRDNPLALVVDGKDLLHPKGVLFLTQFTQVAMAVLARAQVAELRANGVLADDALSCGHSVGEYNALSAITEVLPLEVVVDIVYRRGLVAHHLVRRDANGESGYRMGVIRPHHAGLDHAGAEELLAEVAERTGAMIQIVNFNVRDRQYSVTGETAGLEVLAAELESRQRPGGKAPWLLVPGVDVPFHSRVLAEGVGSFRQTLREHLPEQFDPARLVGRYIPNLVARPFSLERDFVQAIVDCTDDEHLGPILADWHSWQTRPGELARALLIELLAWQFASPVRWIETQELMLRPVAEGGLGVSRVVEVGVGYQPTLTNMLRQTLANTADAPAVRVENIDSDAGIVMARDADPVSVTGTDSVTDSVTVSVTDSVTDRGTATVTVRAERDEQRDISSRCELATDTDLPDRPFPVVDGLRALLALQARVRPEQIRDDETIDELFEGVSSRRNQALLDIGAEFSLGTIDGAHEKPIGDLAAEIGRRAPTWKAPGGYLAAAWEAAIGRVFGRPGLGRRDLESVLESDFGLPAGLRASALSTLCLETRSGQSGRGGDVGRLTDLAPATRTAAMADLDRLAGVLSTDLGLAIGRQVATAGAASAVDAAVVAELEDRVLGPDGVLMQQARDLAERLGHPLEAPAPDSAAAQALSDRVDAWQAEHGEGYEAGIGAVFDPRRHVAFTSSWAQARRDMARLGFEALNGRMNQREVITEARRLAAFAADPVVVARARWLVGQVEGKGPVEGKGQPWLADAFAAIASGAVSAPLPLRAARPKLEIAADGSLKVSEEIDDAPGVHGRFAASLWPLEWQHAARIGPAGRWDTELHDVLVAAGEAPLDFSGRTALITGASPGSIALEVARHLLRGGARVVLTTSAATPERLLAYRRFYQEAAAPGAELHVVPFNQASQRDIDSLLDWLFGSVTEQAGPSVRVLKGPFAPDLLVPFAALGDTATLDGMGGRAELALRAMLQGVERLVGGIATRTIAGGLPRRPCHVLLPLSPNHGSFGGDGAYAETKAALEVLQARWQSEHDAWGRATTLCAARIGWVRSTNLMAGNDAVAGPLEAETGIRTFSSAEMGLLLASLCTSKMADLAADSPLDADLTGGMATIADLRATVGRIRADMERRSTERRRQLELRRQEAQLLGQVDAEPVQVPALPTWPRPAPSLPDPTVAQDWGAVPALDRMVVIVGTGEMGPCGSSRTRYELEFEDELSPAGVLELAWMTGLIRHEPGAGWLDTQSDEVVAEEEIAGRYRQAVRERVGIRLVEPETVGFDPQAMPVYASAWLERDFTFPVASEDEARCFVDADPEHTRARPEPGGDRWLVTRLAGAEVRVPKAVKLSRRVAGQVPAGLDPTRHGLPRDMVDSVDRVTQFNLMATADAFVSAGLEPEELLRWLHPARIANTQGGGIGGMRSLGRLYVDHVLGRERQGDVLQETLINVMAAYVVQSYVGSYGAMAHPVGACATAAVSLEEGADKILLGKADFVVAGGFDDIGPEGVIGFADMHATAATEEMLAMGLEPAQMSRANDVRRRGFVEGQGGATVLLARGDVALELGLPVLGVLGWAGSFGDGIHKSIPAPGMGALACAAGGVDSPLGQALAQHGLSADDIALVYKHDTSTGANDPNENALHERIQRALGRTEGNPLMVVSQKTLTGHAKGGAAGWQLIGLCQAMASGVVPGNRNLDSVDVAMRRFDHLVFSDAPLRPGPARRLKAGLLTSLGFGHVGALALVLHPDAFLAAVPADERSVWQARADERLDRARAAWTDVLMGRRKLFTKRTDRRFVAADGSDAQADEEAAMLLDPGARLDPAGGVYVAHPAGSGS